MSLRIRKIIVISLIGLTLLAGNILLVANWLAEQGIEQKAQWLRQEFLTGTTIAITIILLILLVSPKNSKSKVFSFSKSCPVCDKRLFGNPQYCGDCGSKIG